MELFELTRALIDIDSTTGRERQVGEFLAGYLEGIAAGTGGTVERMPVEGDRFNLFASWGEPAVVLSTHLDTVPPFFPFSEDRGRTSGPGRLRHQGDAIAAMIKAVEALLAEGDDAASGCSSWWARRRTASGAEVANRQPRGLALPGQRRADGEPARPGVQGGALPGARGRGAGGPLRLPGAGRLGHRPAARRAGPAARRAAARRSRARGDHAQHRHDLRAGGRPTWSPTRRGPRC